MGVAWGLILPDEPIVVGTAGFRDGEQRLPFAADTRFHVGSVTKALLATGVLRLVTEGLLDLDAPLSDVIPELAIDNPWRQEARVTVRHLLDHTAGFEDARLWHLFSERATPDSPLGAAFPPAQNLLWVRTRPGSQFSYSNMGYGALGLVIEKLTGKRYERYLDAELLSPLGLDDSTFAFTTQTGDHADTRLAWGHVDDGTRYAAAPVFLRPAAQFTTTARDLGRFATFLLGDGTVDGSVFIAPELMAARGRASGTLASDAGLSAGYALGLGRRDRHGVIGYCHAGNIVGFVAMLCIFPDEQKAFVYSVNTDSESANYARLAEALIARLDIAPAGVEATHIELGDLHPWLGYYVPSPNRFSAFRYLDRIFGASRIELRQDTLVLEPLFGPERVLRPTGDRLFSAADRSTTSHVLFSDEGHRFYSDGFNTHRKVSVVYVTALRLSLVLGLAAIVWFLSTGIAALLRERSAFGAHVVTPVCAGLMLFIIPVLLFFGQPYLALGDVTPGAIALAVTSGLLPLATLGTLLRAVRSGGSLIASLHITAGLALLQWCAVLFTFGMLPLRLWS